MSRPTILVLAASTYQLSAITTAKKLGFRVVTTDNESANPGHALADVSYGVDTLDLEGVLRIAKRERIDGVIAPCTDVAVPTAAYVAQALSLPGPPYASAVIACSKSGFRRFMRTNNLPAPESIDIDPTYRPDAALFAEGAWIMKPDRSSGSKGVFVVRSPREFEAHVAETLSFSPDGCGVLEKYIEGFQGTCEGILEGGRIVRSFFLDRRTVPLPHVATCGHIVPTVLPPERQRDMLRMLEEVWGLLQVTDGPFDCDFVVGASGAYILEMTPRLGGNSIAKLLSVATGFDIVEYSIRHACGATTALPSNFEVRPTSILIFGTGDAGVLTYDEGEYVRLQLEPWIESISMDLPAGAPVEAFINGRHRVGEALVHGEDRDVLERRIAEVRERMKISVRA